jgi:CRP/FNR family transcriptional regulator
VALVRVMELEQLAERAGEGELGNQLMHRILTQAMVQDATLLCMLETLDARIRVAAFLLSLRNRFARVHRPPTPFDVPVSDAEIGSYLRLPDEAVGAVLREFVDAGVIDVRERKVSLTRPTALAAMVEEGRQSPVRHAVVPD